MGGRNGDLERSIYILYMLYNITVKYMIYHINGNHMRDTKKTLGHCDCLIQLSLIIALH